MRKGREWKGDRKAMLQSGYYGEQIRFHYSGVLLGDEELGIYPITPVHCCLTAASGSAHFPAPEWTISSPEKAISQKGPGTGDGRQQVCIRW